MTDPVEHFTDAAIKTVDLATKQARDAQQEVAVGIAQVSATLAVAHAIADLAAAVREHGRV